MRTIFLLMNVSVDGYFEAPGHDLSWTTSSFDTFSPDGSQTVDTFLLGRRTYEMMKSFWPTPQAKEVAPEVAKVMNETHKVVASRQPFDPGWHNVTVISGDVAAEVKKLKAQPGKTIAIFGSNTLCVSLMQEGLIDQFNILVNPVALGEGTPLFAGLPNRVALRLRETQRFDSGTALLVYEPVRESEEKTSQVDGAAVQTQG